MAIDHIFGMSAGSKRCARNAIIALACLFLAVAARAQSCTPVPAGIVSWWSGEGNGFDNLGTNHGFLAGPPNFATGVTHQAFSLNVNGPGTTQFVLVPDSPSLRFSNAMTLEAWVYPTAYNDASSTVLCKYDALANVNQCAWCFSIAPNGQGSILVSMNGVNGTASVNTTSLCPLRQWTHLAATYDSSTLTIYFNGNAQGSVPLTGNIFPGTDSLGIGANIGGTTPGTGFAYFYGLIDEAAVFNRALSAAEVRSIYLSALGGLCPVPNAFLLQPTNHTVYVGDSATFQIHAKGAQPLYYQWYFNGGAISGATTTSLTVTNLQTNQSGNYSAVINSGVNPNDNVQSTNAVLTVLPLPPCDVLSSGMVSWWSGESNAVDNIGGNNGNVTVPNYAKGKTGTAFQFDGSYPHISVPDAPNLHFSNAMTLEAWINPNGYGESGVTVLCKYDALLLGEPPSSSWALSLDGSGHGNILISTNGSNAAVAVYTTNVCPLNTWTHLAATYDNSNVVIYMNGVAQASAPLTGNIYPGINAIGIGANVGQGLPPNDGIAVFGGLIDEPAIFNRALSPAEIYAIYYANTKGICPFTAPANVYVQPTNQAGIAGSTVTFAPNVSGSPPLHYQWRLNGTNVPAGTNLSLTIANIQFADAGAYSLLVSGPTNSTVSSNALLGVQVVTVAANGVLLTNSQNLIARPATIQFTNYFTNGPLFYTLDGSTPTAASTAYSGPFIISNSCVVRAIGFSADLQQSYPTPAFSFQLQQQFLLTDDTPGGGSVTFSPPGSNYFPGTVVTLTAVPAGGWSFLQWQGDVAGFNASNTIIMNRDKSVRAIFGTQLSGGAGGPGSGSIVFDPPGPIFPFGSTVQAAAIPQPGNFFGGWSGGLDGYISPSTLTVSSANLGVSAYFGNYGEVGVHLYGVPVGRGNVSANPLANAYYAAGTSVTVTATPAPGHTFLGWTGSASGTNNPLTVQVNADEVIYGSFSTNTSLVVSPVGLGGTAEGVAIDLLGDYNVHYQLQSSTDLTSWTNLYDLTNYVGTIHYIDSSASNLNHRFYRAKVVP